MNKLWVLFVGWWAAPLWFCMALLLCWNPVGWVMMYQVPTVFSGEFD